MNKNSFTEEDKLKFVEFMNFMAERFAVDPTRAWKAEDSIKHFKLLAHMQQSILPKIEEHILEVRRVIEPEQQAPKPKGKAKR